MTDLRETILAAMDSVHDMYVTHGDYADAIIRALPGAIKPLVWLGGGARYHAGDYVIEDVSTKTREVRRLLRSSFGTSYVADFAGDRPLAAAQAAAEAHHRAVIMRAFGIGEG